MAPKSSRLLRLTPHATISLVTVLLVVGSIAFMYHGSPHNDLKIQRPTVSHPTGMSPAPSKPPAAATKVEARASHAGVAATLSATSAVTVTTLAGNTHSFSGSDGTTENSADPVTVTTFAGSPNAWGVVDGTGAAARFTDLRALTVDRNGSLYVAQMSAIRKITAEGVVSTIVPNGGLFDQCSGIAVDKTGNIYMSDAGPNPYPGPAIYKITPEGVMTVLVAGSRYKGKVNRQPCYMAGTKNGAPMFFPYRVNADEAGNVYFGDGGNVNNPGVFKVTSGGEVSVVAGFDTPTITDNTGRTAKVVRLGGVDERGNVYIYCRLSPSADLTLCKITPSGVVTTIRVGREDRQGTPVVNGAPDEVRMSDSLSNIAVDRDGTGYIADAQNAVVYRIAPKGVATILAGKPNTKGIADGTGNNARFSKPCAVALNKGGDLYVAEEYTIRKITIRKDQGSGRSSPVRLPVGVRAQEEAELHPMRDTAKPIVSITNPHFPALRSGHRLFQWLLPGKQFPSIHSLVLDPQSGRGTWPVGQKAENELELYDMSGNVCEWCWDFQSSQFFSRIYRGGSWDNAADRCTVAIRWATSPNIHLSFVGFRRARNSGN